MLTVNAGALLRIAVAVGLAGGVMATDDGGYANEGALQQGCTSMLMTPELEDALSNMRGLSNGGSDPVCGGFVADGGKGRALAENH